MAPCGANTKLLESHETSVLDMYGLTVERMKCVIIVITLF